jgi:acetylornithine deacetylase/succinyl-diaminopimelate desuccinylase-like protein
MNTNVLQNEVIELAQSLFRIPSTTGNEAEIASFIKNIWMNAVLILY